MARDEKLGLSGRNRGAEMIIIVNFGFGEICNEMNSDIEYLYIT